MIIAFLSCGSLFGVAITYFVTPCITDNLMYMFLLWSVLVKEKLRLDLCFDLGAKVAAAIPHIWYKLFRDLWLLVFNLNQGFCDIISYLILLFFG